MNILQVSTFDLAGGAERVAHSLFEGYRRRGHTSHLAVGKARSNDKDVMPIPVPQENTWQRQWHAMPARLGLSPNGKGARMAMRLGSLGQPRFWLERQFGLEHFGYPGTRGLLRLFPEPPDIVHAHNLHGGYFDLGYLPDLSGQAPLILTLHDAWLLSGHCAHSLACERWLSGCGHCPDLTLPIPLRRDATAYNWRRKQRIYRRSRVFVATPSNWLMEKVRRSMLWPSVSEARVIPNGIDLTVFRPGDRTEARQILGLPPEAQVVLFVGRATRRSPWKDYLTMERAIAAVASQSHDIPLVFVCLGEQAETERIGRAQLRFDAFQDDIRKVVAYYRAADIYLHAARADTFPSTVLEAMACGLPVIATAVGGITEQVQNGITGLLAPPADGGALAAAAGRLLSDASLRERMGAAAIEVADNCFDQDRMISDYLTWYERILAGRRSSTA